MKKKLLAIAGIVVVLIACVLGYGAYSSHKEEQHWAAPFFNETGEHVLLSDKVDELNEDQESEFYNLVKSAIANEAPNVDLDMVEDKSLYVEKLKAKQTYYIKYICTAQTAFGTDFKFKTDVTMKLKDSDLKKDTKYTYWDFHTTLNDF